MARELKVRHGVECFVVRNPTAEYLDLPDRTFRPMDRSKPVALLYTGAVYAVNQDTVENVLHGVESIDDPQIRLVLYTAQSELFDDSTFSRAHLDVREHVPPREIEKVQQDADILLLPFTFHANAEPLIRTSGTAKLADYLASGRPLLAIAPSGSLLVDYLTRNDCGFVCTGNEPARIAARLREIVNDQDRCAEVCANALRCAVRDFSPGAASAAFQNAVASGSVA